MKEELKTEEIKAVDTKKEKNRKMFVFGIVFLFVILFIVIIVLTWHDTVKEDKKSDNSNSNVVDNHYNYDYKYVVQTYFGADAFIYLLKDDSIKVVVKMPVYKPCEAGMKCIDAEETGEFEYEERTIEFSDKSMDKARDFITSLFKNKRGNYINLENVKLTKEEKRVEFAILLAKEDMITFQESLIYNTATKELKDSAGKVIFKNSKTTIAASNNKIVNTIANYLNVIVDNEWAKIEEECNKMLAEGVANPDEQTLGITYSLELVDLGSTTVSFNYFMNGTMGGVPWNDKKGYVFNSATGTIEEYPNGWKDKAYTSALGKFKKDDFFKNSEDKMKDNWETILKEYMFLAGNWYLKDDKIIFLVPEDVIMDFPMSSHIIEIEIENTFGNF